MNFLEVAPAGLNLLLGFAFAVPWVGLAYLFFHGKAPFWNFFAVVSLGAGIWIALACFPIVPRVSDARIAVGGAVAFLVIGALQATVERSLDAHLSWSRRWFRAFCIQLSALSCGFAGTSMVFVLLKPSSILFLGYLAGVLLTPLSIAVFRWGWPQLRLRPGIDRSLDENEPLP